MTGLPWLNRLKTELSRHRLPPLYVDRLLAELADHAADLIHNHPETTSMEAQEKLLQRQLGNPTHLASAANREYARRTFASRHPVLTFLIAPLPVVALAIALSATLVIGGGALVEWLAGKLGFALPADTSRLDYILVQLAHHAVRFLPFIAAALLFCHLGRTSGRRGWSLVACGIVALLAGAFYSHVTPAAPDQSAAWMIAFAFRPSLAQFFQLAAPLAVGILLVGFRSPKVEQGLPW